MEIQRPRTPNPQEHSREITKFQSPPPPPYPETWSSPSCLPSPSPRAAPFHSRAGGRRGGRPSPAAAAAPRTRPPGAPGGGSPPSSPPPQVLDCSALFCSTVRRGARSDRFLVFLGAVVGVGVAGGEAGAVSTSRRAVRTWRPCTLLQHFSKMVSGFG